MKNFLVLLLMSLPSLVNAEGVVYDISSSLGEETLESSPTEFFSTTTEFGDDSNELSVLIEPQVRVVSGIIVNNETWSPINGVYRILGDVTVAAGASLTILPGTIIKSSNSENANLIIYGNVNAEGSISSPIIFTSIQDDLNGGDTSENGLTTANKGDWTGVKIMNTGSFKCNYCSFKYGGYNSQPNINNEGIFDLNYSSVSDYSSIGIISTGATTIVGSEIVNGVIGINQAGGSVSVNTSSIKNNTSHGLVANDGAVLVLQQNNFSENNRTAVVRPHVSFTHSLNTSTDIQDRGFIMNGPVIDGAILSSSDLPIIITGGWLEIPFNTSVNVEPGTVFKLSNGASLYINGSFEAVGTKEKPIYFTSISNDAVGGDTNNSVSVPTLGEWQALRFESGSHGLLKNVNISYGGQQISLPGVINSLYNTNANVTITDSVFENNRGGLYQQNGSTTVSNTVFKNGQGGIRYRGGTLNLFNNSFATNTGNAIYNETGNFIFGLGDLSIQIIDARNNWWGSESGPKYGNSTSTGGIINDNILFDPWIKRDPSLPPRRNPVIIVPGIMGSRLIDDDRLLNKERWPNLPLMVLPGDDEYLNDLSLGDDGSKNISAGSIIKEIEGHDFFEALFTELNSGDLRVFGMAYDWRLDVTLSAANLKYKIEEIKTQTGAEKVDVIAHSMGGLVFKKYLAENNGNSIGKFIDIGTPHLGAPKAFKILNYGDGMGFEPLGISILNGKRVKEISQHMPSIYQLLPSKKYFDDSDPNYTYYVLNFSDPIKRLSYDLTKTYLKTLGRNELLVDQAEVFHEEIDNLDPKDSSVETYNIVGCGTPTIGQFYILEKKPNGEYEYNIRMINGDGTVPLRSAEAMPSDDIFYVKNANHALMPSTSGVKEVVAAILLGENNPDITEFENLTSNRLDCPMADGKLVSFHSPIELHIYDEDGNHSGPNADGDIENNIRGAIYETIENNNFVFLPNGTDYKIEGNGTGEGTFDLRIQSLASESVTSTSFFDNVSVISGTIVSLEIGNEVPSEISIDLNGDNVFETHSQVSLVINGIFESSNVPITDVKTEENSSSSYVNKITEGSELGIAEEINEVKITDMVFANNLLPLKKIESSEKPKPTVITEHPSLEFPLSDKFIDKNQALVITVITQKVFEILMKIWAWFISWL